MLIFFIFIVFSFSYGLSEFSKIKTDVPVDFAKAGVAKCSCQKCHTIELDGCEGCHNSQQSRQESDNPVTRSEEPHEDESAIPENDPESQSSPVETPGSDPSEPNNDGPQKSGILPDKSKNQQGYD